MPNAVYDIYPNPVNNYLNINAITTTVDMLSVEMFDAVGKRVYIWKDKTSHVIINTSGMANGIYLLKIKKDNTEAFKKVFIKHQL